MISHWERLKDWFRISLDTDETEPIDPQRQIRAAVLRGRLEALIAAACAIAVLGAIYKIHLRIASRSLAISEQTLSGTWALQSIDGDPVGPDVASVILSQHVTFRNGTVHGETRLRAESDAATIAMPFPDESVTRVRTGADGHEVDILWDGTYTFMDEHRVELHIGKATYLANITLEPRLHGLSFDHDAILTYSGAARYRAITPRLTTAAAPSHAL